MMKMSMFKKFLLGFLASIVLLVSVVPYFAVARAQTWYSQPYADWVQKVFNTGNPEEIYGERYTYAQVEWVIYSLTTFALNSTLGADLTTCLIKPRIFDLLPLLLTEVFVDCGDEIVEFGQRVLNPFSQSESVTFLATITTQPVSGVAYFMDIGERLHLISEVKAQGFGFSAAQPVLELWRFVRNTTYFLLMLVIIVMAFMIMFRIKTSPQTVITVQSALPKIILALILITFSYAIAGLLIDLMYVVMGLLAAIFSGSPISNLDFGEMFTALTQRGVIELMFSYLFLFGLTIYPAMFASGIGWAILSPIVATIVVLLAIVILLIATLRILWLMLRTYVMILIQVIIGPVMILMGTLGPGGVGSWFQGILAHLAVYPTVAFMFLLAFVFLRAAWPTLIPDLPGAPDLISEAFTFDITRTVGSSAAWNPPFTTGEAAQELLWLGVSFAIIMMIPNVANIIRGMIERKPFQYGAAIGQAIGPVAMFPVGVARGSAADYIGARAESIDAQVGTPEARKRSILQGIEKALRGRSRR